MTGLLYASALILLIAAALATVVYARAVVHAHRAYLHVVLAGVFVLVAEVVAVLAVSDESVLVQSVLLVANLAGVGAMFALAARFRSRPPEQRSPGESLYEWYRARRGYVGYVAVVIIAVIGFIVVQGIAEDAGDAAEDADQAAAEAERSSKQNQRLAAANSRLNCGFAKLIRGSPIVRRPEETAEAFTRRIVIIRDFAHDVRILGSLLDRFNLERGANCNVTDLRVRLTPADRAALVPEILDRARGGDAVGSDPGGGGGQPGGQEPPAEEGESEQGLADPIVDPAEDQTGIPIHCDVSAGGEVVCTEPD